MKRLLLALVLTGCGGPPPVDYLPECLGELTNESPRSYDEVSAAFFDAREVLISEGIVPEAEFCPLFKRTTLTILPDIWLTDCPAGECRGMIYPDGRIILGRHFRALLHEMLHWVDLTSGTFKPENVGHGSWPALWWDLDRAFHFWER